MSEPPGDLDLPTSDIIAFDLEAPPGEFQREPAGPAAQVQNPTFRSCRLPDDVIDQGTVDEVIKPGTGSEAGSPQQFGGKRVNVFAPSMIKPKGDAPGREKSFGSLVPIKSLLIDFLRVKR